MPYLKSLIKCLAVLFAAGGLLLFIPQGSFSMEPSPFSGERNGDRMALGAILPLSGPYAEFGDKILDSLLLAGGFFDEKQEAPVELYLVDSQMKPEKARRGLSELADDRHVLAVIGPVSSEESYAAAEEAENRGVPLITLTRNQDVTGIGPYIFNALPSARTQISHLADYALTQMGIKKIAIFYPDIPAGQDAADFFREEMKKRGEKPIRFIAYPANTADFSAGIEMLTGQKADPEHAGSPTFNIARQSPFEALFIPDSLPQVSRIVSQLVSYQVTGLQLLGYGGWNMSEDVTAHRDLFEGSVFVDGYFPNGAIPESAEFADCFYEAYDREADSLDAYAYDAMAMTLRLIRAAKKPTRDRLRHDLSGMRAYPGVRGAVTVDPLRIMDSQPFLITLTEGHFAQIMEP